MAAQSSPLRRLALVGLVLALGGLGWWLLGTRDDTPLAGRPIERKGQPNETAELLTSPAAPVLHGRPTAEARAPAPHPPGAPGEPPAAKPWRLTFDVVDEHGSPRPWTRAAMHDREGQVLLQEWVEEGPRTEGELAVPGSGYLVVWSHQRVPWVSAWQEPPPSGTRHLEARVDTGLAVAGEVFEQDGITPLAWGEVHVWCKASAEPYRPALGAIPGIVQAGRFRVAGLPPGLATVQAKAYDQAQGRPVKVETEVGDDALRLVLGSQGVISFLVVDRSTGLAPRTKYLEIRTLRDGREQAWSTASTMQPREPEAAKPIGKHLGNPGETYRFRVRAQGYEPSDVVAVTVPDTGGKLTARFEIEPAPESVARLTLLVRTFDPPLPKFVMVTRHRESGSTGHGMPHEDGRIVVELTPGPQRLTVGGGASPRPGEDFWLDTPLEIELQRGDDREAEVWIERGGWVFIGGDPDPQPRKVTFTKDDVTVERMARWQSWQDERGYFLGVLPAGTWTLTYAHREDGRRATVDVKKGEVVRLDPATFESFEAKSD